MIDGLDCLETNYQVYIVTVMDSVIQIMILVAFAFTLLDIVYNGRKSAGRSLIYTAVFVCLALVFKFGILQ